MSAYKIRYRERVCASPKEGQRQSWSEYQVVEGRKVVARFDLESQAKAWVEKQEIGEAVLWLLNGAAL